MGRDGVLRDEYADGRSYEYPQEMVDPLENNRAVYLPGDTRGTPGFNTFEQLDGGQWLIPVELVGPFYAKDTPTQTKVPRDGRLADIYWDGRIYVWPDQGAKWVMWPPPPPAPPVDEEWREEQRKRDEAQAKADKEAAEWEEWYKTHPKIDWLRIGAGDFDD